MPSSDITYASFPFDDQEADLILRSSDQVHFRIYSLLLTIVSPVFKAMVTLPPVTAGDPQEEVDGRPCIGLDDESKCLYQLLVWCDPRAMASPASLEDYQSALRLADKYGMDHILKRVASSLLEKAGKAILQANPLRVYATAIQYKIKPLAQLAAREVVLRVPLDQRTVVPELKAISASALHHLHEYHFACVNATRPVIQSERWDISEWPELAVFQALASCCSRSYPSRGSHNWKSYLTWYMDRISSKIYNHPVGASATDFGFLVAVGLGLEKCSICGLSLAQKQAKFQTFLESLAKKIDRATSQAQLNFD